MPGRPPGDVDPHAVEGDGGSHIGWTDDLGDQRLPSWPGEGIEDFDRKRKSSNDTGEISPSSVSTPSRADRTIIAIWVTSSSLRLSGCRPAPRREARAQERRVGENLDQRHHERRRGERRHQPCRADIVDVAARRRDHIGCPKPPKHREPKRSKCGRVLTMLAHPNEC